MKKKTKKNRTRCIDIIIFILLISFFALFVVIKGVYKQGDNANTSTYFMIEQEKKEDDSNEHNCPDVSISKDDIEVEQHESTKLVTESKDIQAEQQSDVIDETVNRIVDHMSVEEKVNQLFFITPDALTGVNDVVKFGNTSKEAIKEHPIGGLLYAGNNLTSTEQASDMLQKTQSYYMKIQKDGLPVFLSVDEEGGRVTRIGGKTGFGVDKVASMKELAKKGDATAVREKAEYIASYLKVLGFNMDFAPVADVLLNSSNQVIGDRSFGSDPSEVAKMAISYAEGLNSQGIIAVYKHFPGHGSTKEDSHKGYAYIEKSLDQLREEDLVPFKEAIDSNCEFIMVGHISMPELTEGENIPASMSRYFVTELLRGDLGFDGVVITDALGMGAISDNYSLGEASITAINAGCDMLLMASGFKESYEAVLEAVNSGIIEEQRIDEAVSRIVKAKLLLLNDMD